MTDAHCKEHDAFERHCEECSMARLVQRDRKMDDPYDRAGPGRSPSDCRCPVFFPDFCPIHGG